MDLYSDLSDQPLIEQPLVRIGAPGPRDPTGPDERDGAVLIANEVIRRGTVRRHPRHNPPEFQTRNF